MHLWKKSVLVSLCKLQEYLSNQVWGWGKVQWYISSKPKYTFVKYCEIPQQQSFQSRIHPITGLPGVNVGLSKGSAKHNCFLCLKKYPKSCFISASSNSADMMRYIQCLMSIWYMKEQLSCWGSCFPISFLSFMFHNHNSTPQTLHVILCPFDFHKIESTWTPNSRDEKHDFFLFFFVGFLLLLLFCFFCQLWNVFIWRFFKQLKLAHLYVVYLSIKDWRHKYNISPM